MEDLTQDSMTLKSHLVPQLQALNNTVPELVNFGFSVRSRAIRVCRITLTLQLHSVGATGNAAQQRRSCCEVSVRALHRPLLDHRDCRIHSGQGSH